MEIRLLGPVEMVVDGRVVPFRRRQERLLLAALALERGRFVSIERLAALLWDDQPPPSLRTAIHAHVSRVRAGLLPAEPYGVRMLTRGGSYALQAPAEVVDVERFRSTVERARLAGSPQDRAELFGAALSLWRGPALADTADEPTRLRLCAELDELHATVREEWLAARLDCGEHHELIEPLTRLVNENPLQERPRMLLMLALYRCGRRADALEAYRLARQTFVTELGLEPGPELQRLVQSILNDDPGLLARRPVRPAGTVPSMLPADVSGFTGRENDLKVLGGFIEPGDDEPPTAVVIVAIAGTAGIGKTALAVRWAHQLRQRFPDGQLFVNLHGYSATAALRPIDALVQFLRALGVAAEQVPVDVEQAAGMYRSRVAGKAMLIVLDNATNAEQVRPLLPGDPGCVVLVTSRNRLSGLVAREGARQLSLDVLAPDEAVVLLARILGNGRVHAEPEATEALARACGYLPLALRIAAAQLLDHPHRTVAEQLALLTEDRLSALQVSDDPRTAVRAAFELSYTALEPAAQLVFRRLGSAPGPDISPAGAAVLTGVPARKLAPLLDRLESAHLLAQPKPGRYTMHDLLRAYASECAGCDEKTVDRLLYWYLHCADAAARLLYPQMLRLPVPAADPPVEPPFADHDGALAWLTGERANLVAAVHHAARHGPRPVAWLLASTLRGFFWQSRLNVDWLATAQAGLDATREADDPRAQAALLQSLAMATYSLDRVEEATELYRAAGEAAERAGWVEGQASVAGNLGNIRVDMGQYREAVEQHLAALRLNRRAGRRDGEAAALVNLSLMREELGELDQACTDALAALALYRRTGSRAGQANALHALGYADLGLGRLGSALEHLRESLAMHRQVGNRYAEADTLYHIAIVERDRGCRGQAMDTVRTALAVARETGERRAEAGSLVVLATLVPPKQAAEHCRAALRLARDTRCRSFEVEALLGLAAANRDERRYDPALGYATHAHDMSSESGYRAMEGRALTTLASIHLANNDPERAADRARQALAVHRGTGYRLGQVQALGVLAAAEPAAADRYRQEARELAAACGACVETVVPGR